MTQFLGKPDLVAADLAGAVSDLGYLNVSGLPPILPPLLGGLDYKSDRFRVVTPDGGGDNGSLLNDRLAELDELGGGSLILDSGGEPFPTSKTIAAGYSNVSIVSRSSKGLLTIQKGDNFPDGDPLLSCRGTNAGGNTGSSHVSSMLLSGFGLSGRSPSGTQKAGYLLDTSYSSSFRYEGVQLRRCPNTAWYREEEWDAVASDMRFINCGGPSGAADAIMRIVSSTADCSNNLLHFGMWFETFPHMWGSLELGANSDGIAPYNILFIGTKAESVDFVNGATMFRASEKCRKIHLLSGIVGVGGVNAVGGIVNGIENNGKMCITEDWTFDVRATDFSSTQRKPTLGWAVRGPTSANNAGGVIRDILAGPANATIQSMVNLPNLNNDGGPLDWQGRFLVENVRPEAAGTALFSGPGWDTGHAANTTGVRVPQLANVPTITQVNTQTTGTPNATFRRDHFTNRRPMPLNFAIAGTATIPPSGAATGDTAEVVQEGAGAITVIPFSGVTLDVPTGLSATTPGQGRSVRVRCIGPNAYRVIG